jgi:phosphoribosylamine--glycine ligase
VAELESVLIVGSGGREFALLEEAMRSVRDVYSTRGDDAVDIGIEGVINTGLGEKDLARIGSFAAQEEIGLVVCGPEGPLVRGLGNIVRNYNVPFFGPDDDGAVFEDDKTKTHRFVEKYLKEHNPNNSEAFTPDEREAAKDLIRHLGPENIYTKRVGQEGGKGAVGYGEDELEAALDEVDAVADKGEKLLVQGRLLGPEYSGIFMLNGKGNAVALALSRDHKSLYNGGLGPNTGGMGAFAPLSLDQASVRRRQEIEEIGQRAADGLVQEGIDYRGALYIGLMAETQDPDSALKILEFNVRFGDPEMQVLLQTLGGRAIEYMHAAAQGSGETDMRRLYLDGTQEPTSLTVCLASPGYTTDHVETGLPIHVPEHLPDGVSVQYAGAIMQRGVPVSTSGRVAYITKRGANLTEARKVYNYIGAENGGLYIGDDQQVIRTDIGLV